jgi:hypothetical protein
MRHKTPKQWISFKIVKGGELGTMSITLNVARSGGIAGDGQVFLSERGDAWDFYHPDDSEQIVHFPAGSYGEGDLYSIAPDGTTTCSRDGAPTPHASKPARTGHHSNWMRTTP